MERTTQNDSGCCGPGKGKTGKAKPLAPAKDLHPDHSSQLSRLNRVLGQIEGVKRMVEQRRYCPEILIQTRAVASALKTIELGILETHLRHCVTEVLSAKDAKGSETKMEELISILSRF